MPSTGALSDITILDLTRVLCGPYCTMQLADMGANVIKIETPKGGDDTRAWGPFRNDSSVYFASINRNKRSITLNLKAPEAKELFKKMVREADVVIENYRPGVMDKLGLGYDVLKEINDQLIYAEVSGFGSYGPYSQRPGYDILAQAMGGIMSITGQPNDPPTRVGNSIGDILGSLNITIGILAALHARTLTGKGQKVDVSLVDTIVSACCTDMMRYLETGKIPERMGNRYAPLAPYDSFHAIDGEFIIACGNQKLYEDLCNKVLHRPELITDPRFATVAIRAENHALLKPLIEEWSTTVTIDEGVAAVMAAGIPAGPIYDASRVTTDHHIADVREMYVKQEHPVIGEMTVTGNAVKLMDTKPTIRTPAPLLGQHNAEVYSQMLGLDEATLAEYKERGII